MLVATQNSQQRVCRHLVEKSMWY